ncbi:MAG: DUF3750 domain-containing protein [bacterium]
MSIGETRPVTGMGKSPILLGEISGADAEMAIPKIRDAAENYPYAWNYRVWPGTEQQYFHLPPDPLGREFSLRPAAPRQLAKIILSRDPSLRNLRATPAGSFRSMACLVSFSPLPKASASKSLGSSLVGIPCEANSTGLE